MRGLKNNCMKFQVNISDAWESLGGLVIQGVVTGVIVTYEYSHSESSIGHVNAYMKAADIQIPERFRFVAMISGPKLSEVISEGFINHRINSDGVKIEMPRETTKES